MPPAGPPAARPRAAQVARRAPNRYTGADFYALCSDAWMRAAKRSIAAAPPPPKKAAASAAPAVPKVVVRAEDFFAAIEALQPSLSEEELAKYAALQQGFRGSALGGGGHQHRA